MCVTCSKSYVQCPGHVGHIELDVPVSSLRTCLIFVHEIKVIMLSVMISNDVIVCSDDYAAICCITSLQSIFFCPSLSNICFHS